MSISKIRVKSAVIKNNDKNATANTTTAATTTILPFKGTITNATTTGTITATTTTSISNAATTTTTSCITPTLETSSIILTNNTYTTTTTIPGSPKNNDQCKAKILSSSTGRKTSNTNTTSTVAIATNTTTTATATTTTTPLASTTTTTTTTTLLPQTNLLKIEPFVPSLTNRPQKTIRRSYSTLSNTTLRKHYNSYNNNNNHLNKNQLNHHHQHHHLELQHRNGHTKAIGNKIENNGKGSGHNVISGLPKVLKHPATLRRRPALRGPITRQRSKSTSSSNSNSNRPITTQIAVNCTISSAGKAAGTPCNSPSAPVVIQQPNGICRIQRQAKEQEKLPDRVNYDKRGLTAIPIFENETNLRLLSLQHNLINTFHIPKEQKTDLEPPSDANRDKEENKSSVTETANREQIINGLTVRNTEQLNILGNQTLQHQMHSLTHQHHHQHQHPHLNHNNKQRLPLAIAKPNVEQLQPQIPVPGQLMLPLNAAPLPQSPLTFGSFILQRNKLLHRSINMNNCHVTTTNHKANLQHTAAHLRMGLRKSQSFVSNLNLQLNLNKRAAAQNQRTALLKRNEGGKATLASFDSSSSNLNTDSTQSSVLTTETEETPNLGTEEEGADSALAIKNNQLIISYGNIFQNLVFLDLYDNQIERICNLDGLPSLTVLLLGKNRICDISGLSSLKATLRVLDLHGNKLCSVSNKINCLKELKSLNLAGNQIRQINHNDFLGLQHLKELNLKRNKLKRINGFQHLTALERLWLCHNDLHKVDDMASIAKAQNLIEITIENNPLTLAGDCVSFLVSYLPKLQSLSQMPITEQVRKAAMTWRSNKELSAANCNHSNREVFNIIRREEIISNARTNWELLRSQQMVQNSLKQQQQQQQQHQQQQHLQQQRLTNKNRKELEKITETNENNYDEFIKLPPIENHQLNTNTEQHKDNMDAEEHSSTASSLGPNVNSSSSCYSSQDEDDDRASQPNHIDKPMSSSSSSLSFLKSKQHQMENVINHASPNDNKHGEQPQPQPQPHSYKLHTITKQSCNSITTLGIANPTMATATTNCAPTLNLQFPMETNKVSGNQQNQAVTSTATSVSSLISSTHIVTATNATISSSALVASTVSTSSSSSYSMAVGTPATATASTAIAKRYVTGSLMRSQTIVGTVTGAASSGGGGGGGVSLAGGGYTNGYMVKTNTVTTANNIRCQSKLNPNVTTQTAAITAIQQQTTVTVTTAQATAMTMISPATTTGYTIASAMASNNNSLMASTLNGNNTSLTLNTTTKTPVTVASNSITAGIAATAATHVQGTATTAPCGATSTKLTAIEREREQGGDYLIEICGRYLNIYGQGALRFIDKQWNPTKANDVHTLNFSYINFNNIASILGRIKVRFVHAENFVFRETNITSLGQLNALAELQGITALSIDDEGNPITAKDLWREYAIYRLSHWGLKTLNGQEVTPQEIDKANNIYAGLSDLILWSMPDAMLQPLLTRLRLDESCTASKMQPKQWLRKPDNKSLRLVVGKEALQWKKSNTNQDIQQLPTPQQIRHLQNQWLSSGTDVLLLSNMAVSTFSSTNSALTTRERGKIHFTLMMENTCNAVEKLHKLEQIWPTMLLSIIRNTLLDYSQLDVYIRNLMAEIMK